MTFWGFLKRMTNFLFIFQQESKKENEEKVRTDQ